MLFHFSHSHTFINVSCIFGIKMGTPLIVIHPNEMGAPCAKFCQHLSSVHAGIVKSSRSSSSQLLLASLTDLQTMIRLSLFIENCINSSISLLQRKSYIKPSQHPFDFHRYGLFINNSIGKKSCDVIYTVSA